jgi:hypothetical protein
MARNKPSLAQGLLEYTLVIALAAAAIIMMNRYVFRAVWAGIKGWETQVNDSMADRPTIIIPPPSFIDVGLKVTCVTGGAKNYVISNVHTSSEVCFYNWRFSLGALMRYFGSGGGDNFSKKALTCVTGIDFYSYGYQTCVFEITANGVTDPATKIVISSTSSPPSESCDAYFTTGAGKGLPIAKLPACP